MINIGGRIFELVLDHKGGWNPEAFRERYSEVLDRYDYVIGDWGYNQLRLKGFFHDKHPKATKDTAISHLVDYLQEYCNFGCAYFVLRRVNVNERFGPVDGDSPSVFTSALSATGETAAGLAAGKASTLPGGEILMRWRADQSTGREGRALRIAAERAELEALILQRELREAREREQQQKQQKRQAQQKGPGFGQSKPHGQRQQHGGKRGGSSGRQEARGGGQQTQGAPGKGDRHPQQPNSRKPDGARGRQPNPRPGDAPRGHRHPKGDRPGGDPNRNRRPQSQQAAPAGSGGDA